MGIQQSKPLERKASKSKSSLTAKSLKTQDVIDFKEQLSTLSCIRSTKIQTFQYAGFHKLPFTQHYSPLPRCKKICQSGQPVFICYDCSSDDHAYLCQACFEKGNHDAHRFSVFPNNNGWRVLFCRCGDEDYMKKKTICETHSEAPKISLPSVDKKDIAKFSAYFNEAFKILISLKQKNREQTFVRAIFNYFEKITDDNLHYSKVLCEFLLSKNTLRAQNSNLRILLDFGYFSNNSHYNILRNLSFLQQYKEPLIYELLSFERGSRDYYELAINFSGKIDSLNTLLKDDNLKIMNSSFYEAVIKSENNSTQIWRSIVKNGRIVDFMHNNQIMMAVFSSLKGDEKLVLMILQQLLDTPSAPLTYIIGCLMIVSPEMFLSPDKKSKSKLKFTEKLEKKLLEYYTKPLIDLSTHSRGQETYPQLFLLLPFFSFGESIIATVWSEMETRIDIIGKNKERAVIKEASMNVFQFVTSILSKFMTWEHWVLSQANHFSLTQYTKDKKLIEKTLMEVFDKKPKILRLEMLRHLDQYTQKQRHLAKDIIKNNLRYNSKKGKYYNISKKLANNPYNYEQLSVGAPLKLSDWQEHVASKVFPDTFYRLIPKMIKIAQRSVMEDIGMVKTVATIAGIMSIINKQEKPNLKQITRNFIKQIPDVKQNVYYVLAGIRDRLELDIQDIEEIGKHGRKKVKLDLITQIRDKKFLQIKQRQQKMRKKWLKMAQQSQQNDEQFQENICHICKQKEEQKRRFVFPCNFTRNNVVSTLLKSEVTDLDINICLHKVHEDCFDKVRNKGQCPTCKFQINCFLPERPLEEESYTKNWLRVYENIVTTINLESGKSFNSDWATIFLTYLVFSKSFKSLLKNSQFQQKQINVTDNLILTHYKSQLQKWPQLTKQAIKKAEKTVKGQVARQSNTKKAVKGLVLELVIQSITEEPFKNIKRVEKKFREMINIVGTENAQKIKEGIEWARNSEEIKEVFEANVSQEVGQMFKIRKLPQKADDYLHSTSIKCPMCGKYQPTAWQCLFCEKVSCQNCMNTRFHCEREHQRNGIILQLHDAKYELIYQGRHIQTDSLYRNQFAEGWTRNVDPKGWEAHTQQVYSFFDKILHSHNPVKRKDNINDNSDDERFEDNDNHENQGEQYQQAQNEQDEQDEQDGCD